MRTTCKAFISVVVAVVFALGIICCCTVKAMTVLSAKTCHACGQKTAKAEPITHDCCLVKASAAENAPMFNFAATAAKGFTAFIDVTAYSVVKICSKFNLAYLNGPPGEISVFPLYIQSHSLRI